MNIVNYDGTIEFKSDLKALENKANNVWESYEKVLDIVGTSEYKREEIRITMTYEILNIRLPYGHPSSIEMVRQEIEGLVPATILYLDNYIQKRDDENLEKVIDSRERYHKAIDEFRKIDKGLEAIWFDSDWRGMI